MDAGRLPNLGRLAARGQLRAARHLVPPQSPVAWSNFITGIDAGGHGIFDFIHRDPKTMAPYFSTLERRGRRAHDDPARDSGRSRCTGGTVHLLRRGRRRSGRRSRSTGSAPTIMRMPANFPPSGTAGRELSGMGTPDILGTYGTFTFYTSDARRFAGREIGGGKVIEAIPRENVVRAALYGPPNPFRVRREIVTADFTVYLDPDQPAVKLVVGDETVILQAGEWSEWVPVRFTLAPTQTLATICRFYLKSVAAGVRALRLAGQHRPARPGAADLHARLVRRRARGGRRPVLHPGNAGGHQGAYAAGVSPPTSSSPRRRLPATR